jgi:DNA polymerase III subunit gamma/tau
MDKFVVSARKYRPQTFETVIGQQHITTTLKNAIANNQLAHAFLFCGPRGVGKTTCARILAKTINCTNLQANGEACNTCSSCVSFDNGASLNIHELDAASNNSVDDIRALTDQVRFTPQAGEYKVYIIDEVHMLTSQAFNAFLKTLEEPPAFAKFILATTEKHKILPTILSRCQIFDFKRITAKDTANHLQSICNNEHVVATDEALHLIARKSEGCMRDALSILDKITSFTGGSLTYQNTLEHLNVLDEDAFFSILDAMNSQNLPALMQQYDAINAKGFEGDVFLNGLAEFFRNLLFAYHADTMALVDVADAFRTKYLAASAAMHIHIVLNCLQVTTQAEQEYRTAKNKKLFVEITLIKLCYLQQAMELTASPSNQKVTTQKRATQGPIKYKAIAAWENKPATEAQLNIEAAPLPKVSAKVNNPVTLPTATAITHPNTSTATTTKIKIGNLSNLKASVAKTNGIEVAYDTPNIEAINKIWDEVADALRSQNKLNTAKVLHMARLEYIEARNHIYVYTTSQLQHSSIFNETVFIIDKLKQAFGPNKPMLELVIDDSETTPVVIEEKQISKQEQYKQLVTKYPNIKKLREVLKLDLEY